MTRFIALALSVVMSLSMTSAGAKPTNETNSNSVAAVATTFADTRIARIGAPILPYGPLIVGYVDDIISKYINQTIVDDGGAAVEDDDSDTGSDIAKLYYPYTHGRWVFTDNGPKYVPYLIHPPMYRRLLDERLRNMLKANDDVSDSATETDIPKTDMSDTENPNPTDKVVVDDKEDNKTQETQPTETTPAPTEPQKPEETTKPVEQKPSETKPPEQKVEETVPPATQPKEETKPVETQPPVQETEPPVEETVPPVIELPQTDKPKECTSHDMVLVDTVTNAEYAFSKSVTDYYECSVCGYERNETRDAKRDVSAGELASYANEIVRYVNAARAEAGLSELWTSGDFTAYAQTRAQEQIQRYGHIRPNGASYSYASGNYYTLGENTSAGYSSARGFYNAFMNSASHRGYIMYEEAVGIAVGIAVAEDGTPYCVMHIICSY